MTFTIKQSDTSPSLQATLKDAAGTAINLNGCTVKFHMKSLAGAVVINETMTIVNASGGVVKYDWQPADTDEAGTFYAEFQVTYSDLSVETFPNTGNIVIMIIPELN